MNLKNIYIFLKKIPFIYLFALSTLFLLIILTTIKTHHKVESYYELAHLKGKYESKLNQLTSDELNEIRLSIISRIVDFSKILNKFKLNKINSTINLDKIPNGIKQVGKLIKKWPDQLDSLNINLNDLKIFYLNRIILEDTIIDKQSSIVNILMKLKDVKFKGKFSLCLNSTIDCLDGEFEQLSNETLINWSAKLTILDQLKFNLNDVNLKNYLDFNKLSTKIELNNENKSNQFLDQIVFEFIRPYLNKEFSKLINYEIGQTISTIYADLFDNQIDQQKIKANSIKSDLKSIDEEDLFLSDKKTNLNKNQTTIQFLRNLFNLPTMISNVMFKFIDQNLDTRNTPKVTFYNQDIEQILKTNLSTLQSLKNKYLSSLREHFENLNLDGKAKQQSLPDIAQPFFELVENQLRDTIETKIDNLINTMSNLNNHLTKLKSASDDNQQENESSNDQLNNKLNEDYNSEIEHSVDNDDILPENDEIVDEYTQTIRSQRTKRQVPCQRGQELDEYVDSLFRFASRLIRAMEPVSIPNATIDLPEYNIKIIIKMFVHSCGATRAHTLQRKRPAWVYCTNESVSLGLTVGFEDLRIKCKFRAIKDGLMFDGTLMAKLEHTKAQVQFTQTTPEEDSDIPVMQRIDRIRIWRLGHVRIIIGGLGNFSQAASMLLTRMLNQNIDQLSPTLRHLEGEIIGIGNNMLRNISIPFFSII